MFIIGNVSAHNISQFFFPIPYPSISLLSIYNSFVSIFFPSTLLFISCSFPLFFTPCLCPLPIWMCTSYFPIYIQHYKLCLPFGFLHKWSNTVFPLRESFLKELKASDHSDKRTPMFIHNVWWLMLETVPMLVNRWMGKEVVVYNGVLICHNEESNWVICRKTDVLWDHYFKWNTSDPPL